MAQKLPSACSAGWPYNFAAKRRLQGVGTLHGFLGAGYTVGLLNTPIHQKHASLWEMGMGPLYDLLGGWQHGTNTLQSHLHGQPAEHASSPTTSQPLGVGDIK
ncbi:hypothetical protein HAV15_000335 [Penicillium sp. str. |nr:hypothetical protein HAV15_000335 [Penicillium sp. str. \